MPRRTKTACARWSMAPRPPAPNWKKPFTLPDVMLYQAAAALSADRQGVESALPEAQDLDAAAAAVSQALSSAEDVSLASGAVTSDGSAAGLSSQAASQAVQLVRLEYRAQGVDGQVQMRYLLTTGGEMLLVALLMAAAAISVGFLASRVSAAIGRDLRGQVFAKVIDFSHARDRPLLHRLADHPHHQRHPAGADGGGDAAAHRDLCADPGHRRHRPGGRHRHRPVLDHRAGGGAAALPGVCADAGGDAPLQKDAEAGGPAEPGQPGDPDRHHADPGVQPREI